MLIKKYAVSWIATFHFFPEAIEKYLKQLSVVKDGSQLCDSYLRRGNENETEVQYLSIY